MASGLQFPTKAHIAEVAAAAMAPHGLRREIMAKLGYSLRELNHTLEEPGAHPLREAHTSLATTLCAAYAIPRVADPLEFLLGLNVACAAKEKAGKNITAPGLPWSGRESSGLITQDCIRIDE